MRKLISDIEVELKMLLRNELRRGGAYVSSMNFGSRRDWEAPLWINYEKSAPTGNKLIMACDVCNSPASNNVDLVVTFFFRVDGTLISKPGEESFTWGLRKNTMVIPCLGYTFDSGYANGRHRKQYKNGHDTAQQIASEIVDFFRNTVL